MIDKPTNMSAGEENNSQNSTLQSGANDAVGAESSIDNAQNVGYNNKRGESYVRTDEFRDLQAESKGESLGNSGRENYASNNEGLRGRLSAIFKGQLERSGINSGTNKLLRLTYDKHNTQFNIYENVDGKLFHDVFEIARKYLKNGELVDLHGIETTEDGIGYNDCYNYLSEDGLSGFSITPNGDLISVFNASGKKGFLYSIATIVKEKAKTLDCYASEKQNLQEIYQKVFGFKTASVMDYNMEYDHDNIAKNHGSPQIAFMVNTDEEVQTKHFTEEQYSEAVEYRDSFVNKATSDNGVASFMPENRQPFSGEAKLSKDKAQERLTDIAKHLDKEMKLVFVSKDSVQLKGKNGKYVRRTNALFISKDASIAEQYIEVFKHEFVHRLESRRSYASFKNYLINKSSAFEKYVRASLKLVNGKEFVGTREEAVRALAEHYYKLYTEDANIAKYIRNDFTMESAEREIVADFAGDILFKGEKQLKDTAFKLADGETVTAGDTEASLEALEELAQTDRNLIQKLLDAVKDLINAVMGRPQTQNITADLRYIENRLKQVYDSKDTKKAAEKASDVKYSLNSNAKSELHKALYDINYRNEVLLRDDTPAIMLSQNGVENRKMVMKASHIRENVFTEEEAHNLGIKVSENTHFHGLGEDFFLSIIDGLDNVKEAYRGTKYADMPTRRENYFLLVSEFKDKNGNEINVPVYIEEGAQCNRVYLTSNKIATVFGKDDFRSYINKQISNKNLVRIKNKSNKFSEGGVPLTPAYENNALTDIIDDKESTVKNNISDKAENYSETKKEDGQFSIGSPMQQANMSAPQKTAENRQPFSGEAKLSKSEAQERLTDIAKLLDKEMKLVFVGKDSAQLKGKNGKYVRRTNALFISKDASIAEQYIEVFKHEFMHRLESRRSYASFKNYLINKSSAFEKYVRASLKLVNGKEFVGTREEAVRALAEHYYKLYTEDESIAKYIRNDFTMESAEREIVADFAGDILFKGEKQLKDTAFRLADEETVTAGDTEASLEALEELAQTDRSLIQKLLDAVKDLINAVMGRPQTQSITADLRYIENRLKQVYDSRDTKKAANMAAKEQYSIVEPFIDNNGNQYDNAVLLDTDFFDGLSPRNWGKHLKNYIENRSENRPVIMPITDENGKNQQLQFAGKDERVSKNKNNHKVIAELYETPDNISKLSVIHIDEIVDISEENEPYYTKQDVKDNHGWLDKNGWLHRNANVINAKNGNIYNMTFDIAKTEDGRTILYATKGKIKKVGNAEVNSLKIRGSGQNSNFNNSITDNQPTVNSNSTQESENYSETEKEDGQFSIGSPMQREREKSIDKYGFKQENISRANLQGELVNDFYNALSKSEWNAFYRELVRKGYLAKAKIGTIAPIVVGDKLVISERKFTSKDKHDYLVIDAFRLENYKETSNFMLYEIEDILEKGDVEYDSRTIFQKIIKFVASYGGAEIFSRYNRDDLRYVVANTSRTEANYSQTIHGNSQERIDGEGVSLRDKSNFQGDNELLNYDEKFSIGSPMQRSRDNLIRYENGEITREKYLQENDRLRLWGEANEKYGSIPEGENASNPISVPKQVTDGKNTKRFIRTVLESAKLDEDTVTEVEDQLLRGEYSYKPVSDESAMNSAEAAFENGSAAEEWENAVNGIEKISKRKIAIGEKLLTEAAKAGDAVRVVELSAELADIFTRAGQAVQAARLLKRMTGEGRLVSLQRTVKTLNKDIRARYGDNSSPVKIDPKSAERLVNAKTQSGIEEAYQQILQEVADQTPATWLDKWNAWRYFAMLSNPKTHIRNIVGNGIFLPMVRIKDFIASGLESTAAGLNQINDSQKTKSVVIKNEYRQFAKTDSKNKDTTALLTGAKKYEDRSQLRQKRKIFKNEALNFVTSLNGSLLEAEDLLFKNMHYIHALAGFLQARNIDLNNVSEEVMTDARIYAVKEAQKATFNDESALAGWIQKFSSVKYDTAEKNGKEKKYIKGSSLLVNAAVESVLPFKRTSINIVKRGLEYSPLGLTSTLTKGVYDVKKGKITATEFIDGLAAGLTGTGVLLAGMLLSSLGYVTGADDDDDKSRFEKLLGKQEYAVEFFGKSYTIDFAAPACIPFFIGVEMMETKNGAEDFSLAKLSNVVWNTLEPITNLSMLSGMQSVIESTRYAESSQILASIATDAAITYATQGIPEVLRGVARTIDSKQRTWYTDKGSKTTDKFTQSAINSLKSKIPGLSYTQAPKIDGWGREVSRGNIMERIAENFFSPGYYSSEKTDDVGSELIRLYDATKENVFPKKASGSISVSGETVYLNKNQYVKYAKAKGKYSFDYINELLGRKAYKKLTDEEKADVITNLYKYANAKAKHDVIPEYDIMKQFKSVANYEKSGKSAIDYYIYKAINK